MTTCKKFLAVSAAVALTAATALPALAFENEFHGLYRVTLMESNFNNGYTSGAGLKEDAGSGFVAYQRARLKYIAKASNDLKLVTQFELDTRFGGGPKSGAGSGYKGIAGNNDSGQMDADSITLETKHVYLDFNAFKTNTKVGIHRFVDPYEGLFCMMDAAGVTVTKKFDALTLSGSWFRLDDQDGNGKFGSTNGNDNALVGKLTTDMIVIDGKYDVNRNITVGLNYINVQRDNSVISAPPGGYDQFELLHMVGVNSQIKVGPANIKPFIAYQFGDGNKNTNIDAILAGFSSKTKVGPGNANFSGLYTSGDNNGTGHNSDFKALGVPVEYFNPSNMWILLRNPMGYSEQTILDIDNTARGRGLMGIFAGYEGKIDKFFYSGNIGYMRTAEQRTKTVAGAAVEEDATIGTEINGAVGYQLFDNMSARFDVAYVFLGDGMKGSEGVRIANYGAKNASDPYLMSLGLAYNF